MPYIKVFIASNTMNEIEYIRSSIPHSLSLRLKITGEACSEIAALEKASAVRPDILLVNSRLDYLPGETLVLRLRQRGICPEVIYFKFNDLAHSAEEYCLPEGECHKNIEAAILDAGQRQSGKPDGQGMRGGAVPGASNERSDVPGMERPLSSEGLREHKRHLISIELSVDDTRGKQIDDSLVERTLARVKPELGAYMEMHQYGEVFQSDSRSLHIALCDFPHKNVSREKERYDEINKITKSVVRKEIPDLEGHEILYYISAPFGGIQKMQEGFRQVEALHKYRFFMRGMNILDWNYVERCIGRVEKASLEEQLSLIAGAIRKRGATDIRACLEMLFLRLIKGSMDFDAYCYTCGRLNEIFNDALTEYRLETDALYLFYDASDRYVEQAARRICGHFDELVRMIWASRPYSNPIIATIAGYIDSHYREPITLSYLSKKMHISKSYLCHLFKQETGENLHQYIKKVRVQKAKEIISRDTGKIYQVAEAVGFENVRYFSTIFKDITGITPVDFKKQVIRNG